MVVAVPKNVAAASIAKPVFSCFIRDNFPLLTRAAIGRSLENTEETPLRHIGKRTNVPEPVLFYARLTAPAFVNVRKLLTG
jgi:hypothetical protein